MEFQRLWNYLLYWQQSFMTFDMNRTGRIDFVELTNALWACGYQVSGKYDSALLGPS